MRSTLAGRLIKLFWIFEKVFFITIGTFNPQLQLFVHNFSAADVCLHVRQTTADQKKYVKWMQTTEAVGWNYIIETHPFHFKFSSSSFYLFFVCSPPYFRVSNFFSLLFLLDKKWIVNFFHHILILLYKLISFLSEWWIKSATNFNTWSRSVLWNINI